MELVAASTLAPAERAALFNAGYEDYLVPIRLDEPTLHVVEHAYDADAAASRVALVEGERAAIANLALRGREAWVAGIGVVPAFRRQGLGEALMRALLDEAQARGIERVWLEVIVENEPAIRLYEKLGFEHVRELHVWSLTGEAGPVCDAPAEDAHAWIRAHRRGREPWQRADETVERLLELEPPPQGLRVDGGAAIVRVGAGRVSLLQLAASTEDACRTLLAAARGLGDSVHWLNLPAGDPAEAALVALGGGVEVRQHELLLRL